MANSSNSVFAHVVRAPEDPILGVRPFPLFLFYISTEYVSSVAPLIIFRKYTISGFDKLLLSPSLFYFLILG